MGTPREELADLLRQSREDAGCGSQGALAKRLHVSRPTVSRAENPIGPIPRDELLESWAAVTGVPLEQLTDLADRCRSGTPEWFVPYLTAEQAATMLRCWGVAIVPGVLQTELYARGVLSVYPHTPERLAELVRTRMQRQRVLGRAHLVAVIDIGVLSRQIDTPKVMAEQCGHLVTVAQRPKVAVHVVPEDVNTGVWAGIEIASRGSEVTVCLTTGLDDVTSTAPEQIDSAMQAFERITCAAMPRDQSLDCLRSFEAQWKEKV